MTSPVEIIFECSIRSTLSSLSQLAGYAGESGARREKANLKGKVRERFNAKSKPLDKLTIGMHVWVQDPVSKKWTQSGRVIAIGERRSYDIHLGDGWIWTRNRKFLRPKVIRFEDESDDQGLNRPIATLGYELASGRGTTRRRKSERNKRKPDRFVP